MSANTQYSNYSRFRNVDSQVQLIKRFDNSGSIGQVIGSNGSDGLLWVDKGIVNPPASRFDFNFTVEDVPYIFPVIKIDSGFLMTNLSQFSINTASNEIILNCIIKPNSLITAINISNSIVHPVSVTINNNEIILKSEFSNNNLIIFNGFFF